MPETTHSPDAAWDRFRSHPRLVAFVAADGRCSYAVAPEGRVGDAMIEAAKKREGNATKVTK